MSSNQTTEGKRTFETLARSTSLVERAGDQLESLILNGSLPPGDRLPTERKLGEILGVSRTVVREAICLLAAKGLVEATSGTGTFVRAVGPNVLCDSMNLLLRFNRLSPEQILEVRSVLEINVAGLAAERAEAQEIAAMSAEISELRREDLRAADYSKHDFFFHIRLAESTRNPLFLVLINSVSTVTIRTMYQMYAAGFHESSNRRLRTEEHLAILEQVEKHDIEGARRAMTHHMSRSLARLREAQGLVAIEWADFSVEQK